MYIKLLLILICLSTPCYASDIFDIFITNDKHLEEYLTFFDNLNSCKEYKFNAERVGPYQIYGKSNRACHVKWTFADCNFPEDVYQKVAEIQKHRAIERSGRIKKGLMIEIKDKEYRDLYRIGNTYCKIPLQ